MIALQQNLAILGRFRPLLGSYRTVATNETRAISDPKKLACHAGVAPFEYRSGTNIRSVGRCQQNQGKPLCPQTAEGLDPYGSMSAIQVIGDFQDYYLRKLGEGKHTMGPPMRVVLNAVRNKLIHRVCAVVRRGEK